MMPQLLPDAPNGEYLPEPPDQKTVSCNGLSGTRYDQMSIDDGVEMLRAMGAVALLLNDDLKAKNAAKEEAEAKLGVHLALKLLPGLEYYRHIFKQHNGERDFRIADCKGIEALEIKIGIPPATVRTWRQRYRHLPEYRSALAANGIPIETKPERIQKCDSCGTRLNLPEGEKPDHDENCPEHPMRRESLDAIKDAAVRAQTYERLILGTGKYAMLPADTRSKKIQELAQGTPVSDVVELDDFSVLLNRIRGREMDEMLSMVKEYYASQIDRLKLFGIDLTIRESVPGPAPTNGNCNTLEPVTVTNDPLPAPAEPARATVVAEPAAKTIKLKLPVTYTEEVSNATEKPSVALPEANEKPETATLEEPTPAPKKRGRPVGSGKKKTEANLLPIINPAANFGEQEEIDTDSAVAIRGCTYIYAPKGQAGEFAPLAANGYRGCGHGCSYCYVPLFIHMKRVEFDAGAVERPDYLSNLRKDAIKYQAAGYRGQVMLSFTTDPYHPGDTTLTRPTIECLQEHGMAVCILTKGGTRSLRDIDLFRPSRDAFASTLTSLDDAFSLKWERNAALPSDRIAALKAFHDHGIYTWVSLEPTLDCESSLEIVQRTHEIVDLYKIGRVNYLPMTKTTDWKGYTERMVELCSKLGVTHYLKQDLQQYLPTGYTNVLRQQQHN